MSPFSEPELDYLTAERPLDRRLGRLARSGVAARTRTIRLVGNVHPLPLRPPAMLAQSAASLDLLSGGRFEPALGAGRRTARRTARPVALAYGTSGFALRAGEPGRIRRFGEETAPAVRELVAKERAVTPR